jgi:hypothetical protein
MNTIAISAVIGIITGLILPIPKCEFEKKTESCIHTMYADKYNGDKFGSPKDTFLKCMEVQHPILFKSIEDLYKPVASTAPTPSVQAPSS